MGKKKYIREFCEIICLKHCAVRREEVHIFGELNEKGIHSNMIYTALLLTSTIDYFPILKIFPRKWNMER